jgi:hypothetical protein
VFTNDFPSCDFEILQTPIVSTATSNASRNTFGGQFVWGAYSVTPASDGQNGATAFAELPSLGGPLFIAPAGNLASGGVVNPTGAAAYLLRVMHSNYGDWEAGGLAIYKPKGTEARLLLDTEAGQISAIYHYRNGSLRWKKYRDTGAESGGTSRTNSALTYEARDDSGNNPIAVLTLLRDGRAQVLGAANGVLLAGAATGNDAAVQAVGSDTNVTLGVQGKGTGAVQLISNGTVVIAATSAGASIGKSGGTLGFYGSAGQAKASAPTTLADVIAIIRGVGLSA